jgi:hypothetical protein
MEVIGQIYAPAALARVRNPATHWIGNLVGLRAGLDAVANKKLIITPARN